MLDDEGRRRPACDEPGKTGRVQVTLSRSRQGAGRSAQRNVSGCCGFSPAIAVSSYKGVSYARNFPDAKRLYRNISPFGDLQIYSADIEPLGPALRIELAHAAPLGRMRGWVSARPVVQWSTTLGTPL